MSAPQPGGTRVPHGATAERPAWVQLPVAVRAAIEAQLAARVVSAVSQGSGYTAGFASRLVLDDGRRVFVKAAEQGGVAHDSYSHEAAVVRALPASVPAPRLRWTVTTEGWLVLGFDDVEGHPPRRPWLPDELELVLATAVGLVDAMTPVPAGLDGPPIGDWDSGMSTWRRMAGGDAGPHDDVPVEWRGRVDELAALEARWRAATTGTTALHFDLRDDNVLLDDTGDSTRVWVCDWNWLTVGAPWLDLLVLAVSAYGDGIDADALVRRLPYLADAATEDVDTVLAALGGFWVAAAAQPLDDGMSRWLRVHQAWYRDASLAWLAARRR